MHILMTTAFKNLRHRHFIIFWSYMQVQRANIEPFVLSSAEDHLLTLDSDYGLRQIVDAMKKNKFIGNFSKSPLPSVVLTGSRFVKPKMFAKLANWMDKLASETLHFQRQTFQIAIRTLINYLEISDEKPNCLQLLGCVSLHLASKINEPRIIAVESYIDCCMGIFTKEEFEGQEIKLYSALSNQLEIYTLIKGWEFMRSQIFAFTEEEEEKILVMIAEIIKDLSFSEFSVCTILSNLISVVSHLQVISKQELRELMRVQKYQN